MARTNWFLAILITALMAAGGIAAITPTAALTPAPAASTPTPADPGCDLFYLESTGIVCEVSPGTYQLFGRDGTDKGLVHAPTDPRPEDKEGSAIYNGQPANYRGAGRTSSAAAGPYGAPTTAGPVTVDPCMPGSPPFPNNMAYTFSVTGTPSIYIGTNAGCGIATPPPPPTPPLPAATDSGPRNIHCIDDPISEPYHVKAAYTRAFDDIAAPEEGSYQAALNGYFYTDDEVIEMYRQANAAVDAAGMINDNRVDFKHECYNGKLLLHQYITHLPIDYVDFDGITTEFQVRQGWDDMRQKYWIYWDDTRGCDCGGQGQRMDDCTGDAANANNGNRIPQFAVTYDAGWTTLLHEGGHTLGTVQDKGCYPSAAYTWNGGAYGLPSTLPWCPTPPPGFDVPVVCIDDPTLTTPLPACPANTWCSPPHASLNAHCYDSSDIMCYADGGFNGTQLYGVWATNCSGEVWDCGLDDYFNTQPTPDNYLFKHWNVGADYVRYTELDATTMIESRCMEDGFVDMAIVCTFSGGNEGATNVRFRVEWGDGDIDYTTAAQGATAQLSHNYAAEGTYLARIYAESETGTPWNGESGGHPWFIKIRPNPVAEPPMPVTIGLS